MNKLYLLIAVMILIFILGVVAFPDIFFHKECYRFNPSGEKFRINCSDLIVENTSYSDSIFKYSIKE